MLKADKLVLVGRILTGLVVLPFLMSAFMKFMRGPELLQGWAQSGMPESLIIPIAILELASVIMFAIPQVSVLGAILLTGYLGGAICTHLRMGEGAVIPAAIGVFAWLSLYLRDPRLRALLPMVK